MTTHDAVRAEHEAEAVRVLTSALGPNHPETLRCRSGHAFTLHRLGRLEEAEAEQRAVFEQRTTTLGADHPDTRQSRQLLAWTLLESGNLEAAEREERQGIEAGAQVIGMEHPKTLGARLNHGITLQRLDRLEEAETELAAVLAGSERTLDAARTIADASRRRLAEVRRHLGT